MPADFPADDVPLVDATIVSAASGAEAGQNGGFVVIMTSDASPEDVLAEAVGLLEDAGFSNELGQDSDLSGLGGAMLRKAPYEVLVAATPGDGDTTTVQYVVSVTS